jgi:hypothetical protein
MNPQEVHMLTRQTVVDALEALDVTYSVADDDSWFTVCWLIDECTFQTHLIVEEGGAFLNIRTEGLPGAPTGGPRRAVILEELNRLSFRFRAAKCMINPMNGAITVTSEQWYADCEVTPRAVAGTLSSMLSIIEELLLAVDPLCNDVNDDEIDESIERN